MAYLLAGKSNENMSPLYFKQLIVPEITHDIQENVGNHFDSIHSNYTNLYSISKSLLKIGTTLLEKLIEADSDEERSHITSLLREIVDSIHADIFIDDISKLPDYYEKYTGQEEYARLVKNIPDDLQYDSFDDYKHAGKYIDPGKLERLKEIVEHYAEMILPEERKEEKGEKLLDMIAKVLNESPSDISTLIGKLKDEFPEAIKPYEIDLDRTVERALGQHTEMFRYRKGFNFWELIDYKIIEELNLQKEGKRQFLKYRKEVDENTEARPPDQRLLVHAMVAFIDEGNMDLARDLKENHIDVSSLDDEEKKLYWNNQWRLSG